MSVIDKIKCPNCGHSFNVEEVLSGKLEKHYQDEFEKKVSTQLEIFNKQRKSLDSEKLELQKQKEQQEEVVKTELQKRIDFEKGKIEKSVKESYEEKLKSLQETLENKNSENKQLRVKEVELLKRESELQEKEEELNLKVEKELLLRKKEIEDKARGKERESFELERIKLRKQLEDSRKLAEEMQKKAEQGSMKLQGDVQEIALFDLLTSIYPFDSIAKVPSGTRGADTIQTVYNNIQQECGIIVYESKRTKNFSLQWIEKLKEDQVRCKGDVSVIVTEVYPSDMDSFGEKDGVWICSFSEVRSLSFVLRQMIIKTHSVKLSQENIGTKMELLYNYLTSSEFVQIVRVLVENYDRMLDQLNSEKKAMNSIWSKREKQIWTVQNNLTSLFGSIRGIAGKELESSEFLQLPGVEDDTV